MTEHEQPFYGFDILKERQHDYIGSLLAKYKGRQADDTLKKDIYEELQSLKNQGIITIPFKIVLRKDPNRRLKIISKLF